MEKRIKKLIIPSNPNIYLDLLALIVIYAFLLDYFKPELILSKTTLSGGDTGSHNYLVFYMKNYLLPNWKIVGWSPDWYAGFPIFQFYFPLPYLFAALLSYLIPMEIAFKIISILGIFLIPTTSYLSLRIMKFKFPVPIIAAIFSMPFLFLESFSMWGGNILSTLAGQFAFTFSLSMTSLFMATFYRYIKNATKRLLIINSVLLAVIVMSHIIPVIVIVLSSTYYMLGKDKALNFITASKVFILSFLLTGFWSVPFILKKKFATSADFTPTKDLGLLFPEALVPFLVLTAIGFLFWDRNKENKDERIGYILYTTFICALLFILAPRGFIWNTRFLPFAYLFSMFVAAYGVNEALKKIEPKWILTFIILIGTVWIVNSNVTNAPHWIKWNYEGFENKNRWNTFSSVNEFLYGLEDGRVLHEYSASHNSFGTPRAFELIPYFARKPVMEGLLIESAITSPFHFFLQSEVSETATCPISGFSCPPFNVEQGAEHLRLFNIKYLVATSAKLKNAVTGNNDFTHLKTIDKIEIYEVSSDGKYVVPLRHEPVLIQSKDWRKRSDYWFKNEDLEVALAYVDRIRDDDLRNFKLQGTDTTDIAKIPVEGECQVDETVENEEININTNCIGKPLLVKISYFPNWKVEGAEKIYLASPAFMMIFPTQENVRIYYGTTASDMIGKLFSIIAVLIILLTLNSKTNQLLKPRLKTPEKLSKKIKDKFSNLQKKAQFTAAPELRSKFKEKYLHKSLLILFVLAYTVYFSRVSILKHTVFGTTGYDLGMHDQSIWLISQGKTAFSTIRGLHIFGDHAWLILILLSPIYWIWADIRALLILQSLVLALGAVPIYLISKDKLKSGRISLAFAASYLLYAPLENVNLWHFHPDALATTFLLFAFYFMTKKKNILYFVFAFLALLCKEEFTLVVLLLGAYVFIKYDKKAGITTILMAMIWLIISMKVILPYYNGVGYYRMSMGYKVNWMGAVFNNPNEFPGLIFSRLFTKEDAVYMFQLLSPVAFLSIASPYILAISSPILLVNMISGSYMQTINYQYTSSITPFIFISSIYGASRLLKVLNFEKKETYLAVLLVVAAIFANYNMGLSPVSKNPPRYVVSDSEITIGEALEIIPNNAVVSAAPFLVPHLTHREFIYEFPNPFRLSYWGVNGENPHDPETVEYIVLKRDSLSKENKDLVDNLLRDGDFTVVFDKRNAIVLKRN
jgi:uncharacterized membrane protein